MAALLVGFQVGARPHYATATVESRPLVSASQGFYTAGSPNLTSWLLYSGYVDADGGPVSIEYSRCASIRTGPEWAQRPDETLAQYNARYGESAAVGEREYSRLPPRTGCGPLRDQVPPRQPASTIPADRSRSGTGTLARPVRPVAVGAAQTSP